MRASADWWFVICPQQETFTELGVVVGPAAAAVAGLRVADPAHVRLLAEGGQAALCACVLSQNVREVHVLCASSGAGGEVACGCQAALDTCAWGRGSAAAGVTASGVALQECGVTTHRLSGTA